jgi:hypothetical protein
MNEEARDLFWALIENRVVTHQSKSRLSYIDYLNILVDSLETTCEVFDIKPLDVEPSEPEASKA